MEEIRLDQLVPAAAIEARAQELRTYRHRVSNVGECVRCLVYQRLGFEPDRSHSGRMLLIFGDGHMHEDATVSLLSKTDFPVIARQHPVDVGEIQSADPLATVHCDTCDVHIPMSMLHGHIDGMIIISCGSSELDQKHILFEHKAIGSFAYGLADKEFNTSYVRQCCCYMKGLRDKGYEIDTALLVLRSKDLATYKQVRIEYDHANDRCSMHNEWNELSGYMENVVAEAIELHENVETFALNGELPDRPYEYQYFKCQSCLYQTTCWDGAVTEVSTLDDNIDLSTNDTISKLANAQYELSNSKSDIEKRLKEVKKGLKLALLSAGVKGGETGNLRIKTRAFDKEDIDTSKIPDDVKKLASRKTPVIYVVVEELNKSGIS